MVELYQWQESQLLTNAFGLAKVLQRLVHVININRVHRSQMNLILAIDFKENPLLHGSVKIRIPHLPRIPRQFIGILHAHGNVIMFSPLVKLCCSGLASLAALSTALAS
jgi:predicted metallopeptidase